MSINQKLEAYECEQIYIESQTTQNMVPLLNTQKLIRVYKIKVG